MNNDQYQVELKAPTLKEANDENFVPLETLNTGITVLIPWSDLFEEGDHIAIGVGGTGSFFFIAEEDIGRTMEHFIPGEKLREEHGRRVNLSYLNLRIPETIPPSTDYDFEAELYRPVIENLQDGTLPWDTVKKGFSISIPIYPDATLADLVRLFFVGSYQRSSRIIDVPLEKLDEPVVISIDKALSIQTNGGEVHVIYQIIRDGKARTSPSISFMSEAQVFAPNPAHILKAAECTPTFMDRVESGTGKMAFSTELGAPLQGGEEVFLLALNSARIQNEISQTTITAPTKTVEHTLSKSILFYLGNFKLITLVHTSSGTYTSNTHFVALV
ncbi:hypothetical protein [Pseudomonas putida]|uniref:Uncharacterized protein n=1 Tax=Pseudomonas putida TaxID=303 RepID=A0A1L5PXX2_PSEPU|nr:hypothetical protein [Pseudomonas putida]APO84876.1 hypothetical protein BL240_26885 [Pseudomonas putida]